MTGERTTEIAHEYWDCRGEGRQTETAAVGQLAARLAAVEAEREVTVAALNMDRGALETALEAVRAERDEARDALTDVSDAYERKVSAVLDHFLPDHTPECDENFTDGACLRCQIKAHMQIAYGMSRPLNAVLARSTETERLTFVEATPQSIAAAVFENERLRELEDEQDA